MTAVFHGGATPAERAMVASRGLPLIDLSASLNPYGPHPAVLAAAQAAVIEQYPEVDAAALVAAYATTLDIDPASVVAGNGSSEILYLCARAFAATARRAIIIGPTFGEYARACVASGLPSEHVRALPPNFEVPLEPALESIARGPAPLVFLCNPNNPTGTLALESDVARLASATRAASGTLIVDEAYLPFAGGHQPTGAALSAQLGGGTVIVRSLTKLHTIPGLRLGFALGSPGDIARIRAVQPPWSVSAPAIAAGLAALHELEFAARSIARLGTARDRLVGGLAALGCAVVPPAANFLLVDVGDAPAFRARLLEHGFVVRDCTSFGLPGYVRVAAPRDEHVACLLEAWAACR